MTFLHGRPLADALLTRKCHDNGIVVIDCSADLEAIKFACCCTWLPSPVVQMHRAAQERQSATPLTGLARQSYHVLNVNPICT